MYNFDKNQNVLSNLRKHFNYFHTRKKLKSYMIYRYIVYVW